MIAGGPRSRIDNARNALGLECVPGGRSRPAIKGMMFVTPCAACRQRARRGPQADLLPQKAMAVFRTALSGLPCGQTDMNRKFAVL